MSATTPLRSRTAHAPISIARTPETAATRKKRDASNPELPPRSASSPPIARAVPAPVDPAFLPAGFDMKAAVEAMKQLLIAQGVKPEMLAPGKVQHTFATDFDGTLGRSGNIPVFLRAKADVVVDGKRVMKAGETFKDPAGNDLMLHGLTGRDVAQDLAALKAAFPALPWDSVQQDWSAFDNRAVAMKTPIETSMVRRLKEASRAADVTASFVITSRTSEDVAGGMHVALKARGADVWGVIITGSPAVQAALGVADPAITDGQRKAIVQMILLTMLEPKSHSWRDDSPSNTGRTIDSLAAKFPGTEIKVYDAIHVGRNHSKERLIARSNGLGQFVDPRNGAIWTAEKSAAHDNAEMPLLPRLTPDAVAHG